MQNMLGLLGNSPDRTPEGHLRDSLNPLSAIETAYNSGQDIGRRNYLAGIGGLLAGALPIPGKQEISPLIKKGSRVLHGVPDETALASKSAMIYDPKPLPQRDIVLDYPNGAIGDATGRPLYDLEGRPLNPRAIIAGRTHVGGGDSGVPAEAYESLAAQATGGRPETVAKSQIGGDAGQYVVDRDRRSGKVISRNIFIDKSLSPVSASRVLPHELSHAVDEVVETIPVDGLNDELRDVFNHLNNPQSHGKRYGPEQRGYSGEKARRELMAEGIRAYMADPNYFKTVAPNAAARIREFVNSHPKLSQIIQFNALASVVLGGGLPQPEESE